MSGTTDRYRGSFGKSLLTLGTQVLHGNSSILDWSITCRKVTITGSQRAIRTAESMIMQKVAYASERVMPFKFLKDILTENSQYISLTLCRIFFFFRVGSGSSTVIEWLEVQNVCSRSKAGRFSFLPLRESLWMAMVREIEFKFVEALGEASFWLSRIEWLAVSNCLYNCSPLNLFLYFYVWDFYLY